MIQNTSLTQNQRNQQATDTVVTIEQRVDGFKLDMGQCRSEWAPGTVTVQDTGNWNVRVGEWYGSDSFATGWDAYNFTTRNAGLEGDAPVISFSASFGYNAENMSGGGWGQPGTARSHSINSVSNPDETCAFITATDWLVLHSGCMLWEKSPVEGKTENSKIAYRHQGKAVVAYDDGHTGLISIDDMKEINRRGGVNNVFWGGNGRSNSR